MRADGRLEERFREITVELIESFRSRGECDLVGDFARVLPSRVIAEVLEVDPADRDDFLRWNHAVNAGSEFTGDEALAAYQELDAYFREVIADRRRHPAATHRWVCSASGISILSAVLSGILSCTLRLFFRFGRER